MGEACSMHRRNNKFVQIVGRKSCRAECTLDAEARMTGTLKRVLKELVCRREHNSSPAVVGKVKEPCEIGNETSRSVKIS
jgi:hypothetical protein